MTREQAVIFVVFPVVGYLLGSVPFAWVIGKMNGVDIRKVGSKNIGSTNLGRTLGARFFWYAFVLDAAKGFVPVLAAALYVARHNAEYLTALAHEDSAFAALANYLAHYGRLPSWSPLVTGAACFLGHLFPVFLKFKGGKGVATSFGVVLGFWPLYTLAGIIAGAFFVFMLMVYRYISLASMSAAVAFVGLVAFFGSWNNRYVDTYLSMGDRMPLIEAAGLFAAAIVYRHRANIGRLIKGTEPRIGQREVEKAKMGEQGGKGEPK